VLSKSPGAILGVATLIILAADDLRQRRSILHTIKMMFLWGLAATFTFVLLAPSMWVQPIGTLQLMSSTAEKFSETAHAVNFFNGSYDRDPGPLFYPVVLAFRSTPIMWLGLIAGIILIVRAKSEQDRRLRSIAWAYWVFAIVFLGVITLGAKKLDRYVLPALDALYIVSALGLAFAIENIGTRTLALPARASVNADAADKKRKQVLNGTVVALLVISALQFIPVWPLTLRAYNPLLGGYAGAQKILPVGGGESAEVGRALQTSTAATQNIAVSDVIGTAPYFSGGLMANSAAGLALADSILFTASDFQLTPDVAQKWIGSASPALTITVQGQPYAWLYPNQWLAAQQQRLQENYQPGDVLVTDVLANVPVPAESTQVIKTTPSEAQAIALLQQIAQSHQRVWVTHYAAAPRRVLNPIVRLLDTYAIQLDEWSSPLSNGALYTLPDQISFTTQPTPLNGGATFGDRIQLNNAELIVPRVQPGQSIGVVGEWAASGSDAQAIVSVMDEAGHQWSAGDALVPVGDTARTRRISVPVPLTMPPGEYQLILNVIDVASGGPLSTRRPDGLLGGTDWPLGSIVIDPAQTPIDAATRQPPITLNAELGGLRAIGSETPPGPIIIGDPWTLAMEWTSTADQLPALDVQWEWAQNNRVAYSTTMPLNAYSTGHWRKGDVLQSKYDFRLPIDMPAGKYDLQFKVIDRATGQPLTDQAGESALVELTKVNLVSRPRTFISPSSAHPLDVTFDDVARLIGADVNRSSTQITVTLYWQANAITATNFTAFVQLIGADDQVQQQIDNWQIAFDAPTSTWLPGQVIADPYVFEVSSAVPQIGVGLYNAATGERLPAMKAGQRLPQDRVIIP